MKRIFAFFLALALCVSLTACGGQTGNGGQSSPAGSFQADPVESGPVEIDPAKIKMTAVQAQEPWFLPLDEVGTYNPAIITDEIKAACTLGEITADALPRWNGLILENKAFCWTPYEALWEEYTPGGTYFTEDQVRFQAEQGFNCIRVLLSFSFLSNPEDVYSINMAELEQLDELLSWCMKYNMHMMLSVTGLPGVAGEGREVEDIVFNDALFFDEAMRKTFQDYWLMLARRYAGIPSGALSYELEAEGSCAEDGEPNMQRFFDVLAPIAQGIWEISPGRIVIVNDNCKEPPEQLAEIGCCLSLHTHVYNFGDGGGYEVEEFGLTDVEHHWPMEQIPRYFFGPDSGRLTLHAEETFRKGTFTVYMNMIQGEAPEIRCDGAAVPVTTVVNERGATALSVDVPEGTRELALCPSESECVVELLLIDLEQEGRARIQLNVPILNFSGEEELPAFRVGSDGAVENLSGRVLDGEYIYDRHIRKFVECARRNHVGFLETEIGTDVDNLTVEEYLAYHTMWLDMMRDHQISWMYNCERNIFAPKPLMWFNGGEANPIPFEHFSRWEGGPYWINDDIMGLLKQYQ